MKLFLNEDTRLPKLPVRYSDKLTKKIEDVVSYNRFENESLKLWLDEIKGLVSWLSNPVIVWDNHNDFIHYDNGDTYIQNFGILFNIITDKDEQGIEHNFVYVIDMILNPQNYNLEVPPSITENNNNTKTQYNMKQRIRLTEGDLHRIIRGCVNEALNELDARTYASYALGRDLQARGLRPLSKAAQRGRRDGEDLWRASDDGKQMAIDAWNEKYGDEPYYYMSDDKDDYVITSRDCSDIRHTFSPKDAQKFGVERDYYPNTDVLTTTMRGYKPSPTDKERYEPSPTLTYQGFEPGYTSTHYIEGGELAQQMAYPNPRAYYVKGKGWDPVS